MNTLVHSTYIDPSYIDPTYIDSEGVGPLAKDNIQVEDDEFAAVRGARVRIALACAGFAFLLVLMIIRLAQLSFLPSPKLYSPMPTNGAKYRADITDRNGELLATTLDTYSVYANPKKVWDPVASTKAISAALPELDPADIEEKLTSNKSFVWIKRNLSPKERQTVFALGLPELLFKVEPKRVYPRGRLAAHVIGFTDIDLKGTAGAERAFNSILSDQEAGPLKLSLDMRVQHVVSEELRAGIEKFQAKSASAVVMNIKSGEVLAMVSLPDFNPNASGQASPQSRLNTASMSVYELGSTLKPLTMVLAEETNVVGDDETIPVHKDLVVQNKLITDDHYSPVALNKWDVLAKSSNRGTAILALRAGKEAQQDLLRRVGLFERVPIELYETTAPLLPADWQRLTSATVSYGHGLSVTPLALSSAMAAVLNDGVYVTPTIVKRDMGAEPEKRRVITSEISQTLRQMMRYVVTDGTGRNADVPGYGVMGKTGTAEKIVNGVYAKDRLVTSFIAAFPDTDPTYLTLVVFDEPQAADDTRGLASSGWNAARVSKVITARIAPILGIRKSLPNQQLALGQAGVGAAE